MERQCKHPTCGATCRREKKEKKRYRIPVYSDKRKQLNVMYNAEARQYRKQHPDCAIKSPNCTKRTQGVHHKKGRGKYLLDKETWIPACNACNHYVEHHHQWAIDKGFKESRLI